jgi:CRP-like cAMP-binding protein
VSQLAQFSFFNNLTHTEQDQIRDVMQAYSLASGEQLITEGDRSDSFYLLINGEVEVTSVTIAANISLLAYSATAATSVNWHL